MKIASFFTIIALSSAQTCTDSETALIADIGKEVETCIETSGNPVSAGIISNCAVQAGLGNTCATCLGDVLYRVFVCNNTCADQGDASQACDSCKAAVAPDYIVNEQTGVVTLCQAKIEEDSGKAPMINEGTTTTAPTTTKDFEGSRPDLSVSSVALMIVLALTVL
jgi:hypothetical protein